MAYKPQRMPDFIETAFVVCRYYSWHSDSYVEMAEVLITPLNMMTEPDKVQIWKKVKGYCGFIRKGTFSLTGKGKHEVFTDFETAHKRVLEHQSAIVADKKAELKKAQAKLVKLATLKEKPTA